MQRNYYIKIQKIVKDKNKNIKSQVVEIPFKEGKSKNLMTFDILFLGADFNKYWRRYDWAANENFLKEYTKEFLKDTQWINAGKIVLDRNTYANFTNDELKWLVNTFIKRINKEILFTNFDGDFEQKINNLAKTVFEFQNFSFNLDLSPLNHIYIFNNFLMCQKDLDYLPFSKNRIKDFNNIHNEFTLKTSTNNNEYFASFKFHEIEYSIPISKDQYLVLEDEIEYYIDKDHEWVQLYNVGTTFYKTKVIAILRDEYKKYFYAKIKNGFNFIKANLVKLPITHNDKIIGHLELDKNQVSDKQIEEILRLLNNMLIEKLIMNQEYKITLNKYEFSKAINEIMDEIYALVLYNK